MRLFTKAILKKLTANGASDFEAIAYGRGATEDFVPVVKLFTPDGAATWLLTALELDTDGEGGERALAPTGRAFGLCDLGMGFPELGYVSIDELMELRGAMGLPVERDRWFKGSKPLSEYADEARAKGRIAA